jgi:hypothetical protein
MSTFVGEQLGRPPEDSSNPLGRQLFLESISIDEMMDHRPPAAVYSVSRAATRGQAGPRFPSGSTVVHPFGVGACFAASLPPRRWVNPPEEGFERAR